MLKAVLGIVALSFAVSTAMAASWTPNGGQPATLAPDGPYTGDVQLVVDGDLELIQIISEDPPGILTI